MARAPSDRLRRFELLLLGSGAVAASVLLALDAGDQVRLIVESGVSLGHMAIYGLKLLMMEAAILAPFVMLTLLSGALLRETARGRYRWAGLGISMTASAGVVLMLIAGLVAVQLEGTVTTIVANVVPALVLLSACGLLYGGLIRLARHGRLERVSPSSAPASLRSRA